MTTYTVEFTDTEDRAMQYVAISANDWIQNASHERARIAIDEIVQISVQKFLELGQPIPGTKEEIVAAAYTNGWIKTAAQRNNDIPPLPPIANN